MKDETGEVIPNRLRSEEIPLTALMRSSCCYALAGPIGAIDVKEVLEKILRQAGTTLYFYFTSVEHYYHSIHSVIILKMRIIIQCKKTK
jgi:hypothetical protein